MTATVTDNMQIAINALKKGQIIACPTESVYGLSCDPFNASAVNTLLRVKKRELKKGFIVVGSSWEQIAPLVQPISPPALSRVLSTWPGPFTWIFPADEIIPQWIHADLGTIAVRISNHPTLKALCEQYGGPLISTSANIANQYPARDAQMTDIVFGKQISVILKGQVGRRIRPTQIMDAITGDMLRE